MITYIQRWIQSGGGNKAEKEDKTSVLVHVHVLVEMRGGSVDISYDAVFLNSKSYYPFSFVQSLGLSKVF